MSREENTPLERREFIKKLGKYAVVTPPVVATLMTDVHAAANSNGNGAGTDEFCARNPNHNKCQ
jgi:hypothetical protein